MMLKDNVELKSVSVGRHGLEIEETISICADCEKIFTIQLNGDSIADKKENLIFAKELAEKVEAFAKEIAEFYQEKGDNK